MLLTAARVLPVSADPLCPGAVAVRDGAILAVGAPADLASRYPELPVRDLGAAILAPGFVDAHCHTEWSLAGGLVRGEGFGRWLAEFLRVMPLGDPDHHRAASALAVHAALCAGTTTLCDAGPLGTGVGALTAAGMRGVVCVEAFGDDPARGKGVEQRVLALDAEAGPLVRVGVSPHAPYSAGPALWRWLRARPGLAPRVWATHLAESPDEARVLARGDGPLAEALAGVGAAACRWDGPPQASPVARMAAAGVLEPGLVAAHCVLVDATDAALLGAAGVRVAHCPVSNSRLGCGRMPLELLLHAGVQVGLGTDSPASAGAYDVRAEARACEVLHGGTGRAPSAAALVELATLGGARALGLDDAVGSLEPGKRADLVAVVPAAGAAHVGDPCEALLRADGRVAGVWVDGEQVLRDGVPVRLDPGAIAAAAAEMRRNLC